jgi:Lon protease-like protein
MSDEQSISINFGRPIGLFPLHGAVLLPQQLMPLHVFEPRYRQLVEHALDGSGLFALALFKGEDWKTQYHGRPPIRRSVCVGRIAQHERSNDGRYNIMFQGVCRAKIVRELPGSAERLYRAAMLEPFGNDEPGELALGDPLAPARERLKEMLTEGPLTKLVGASQVAGYLGNEELPSPVVMDVVAFALIHETEVRYRILEAPSAEQRTVILEEALDSLRSLIRRGQAQRPDLWPKGCSWN